MKLIQQTTGITNSTIEVMNSVSISEDIFTGGNHIFAVSVPGESLLAHKACVCPTQIFYRYGCRLILLSRYYPLGPKQRPWYDSPSVAGCASST